jgi:hypothetical protein
MKAKKAPAGPKPQVPPAMTPSAPPVTASTPTGPTGPTATEGTSTTPSATATKRAAEQAMDNFGDGDGTAPAWAAGALVAGVAALAAWRLTRRRRPSVK